MIPPELDKKRRDRKIEEKYRRDSADALKAALGDPYTKDKILADVPIRTWAMEMMRHCRDFGFTTEGQFMGHIWNQLYPDLQELCTKPNNQTRRSVLPNGSSQMAVAIENIARPEFPPTVSGKSGRAWDYLYGTMSAEAQFHSHTVFHGTQTCHQDRHGWQPPFTAIDTVPITAILVEGPTTTAPTSSEGEFGTPPLLKRLL
ncbi:hypothetical protein F4823DRAFT_636042 [Ustulina deusta]|nr:hypothetical protein F4823DRAFT_636042 [Ustulina deusta]